MRRLLFIGVLVVARLPVGGVRACDAAEDDAAFRQRLPASPPTVVLRFDQTSRCCRNRSAVLGDARLCT